MDFYLIIYISNWPDFLLRSAAESSSSLPVHIALSPVISSTTGPLLSRLVLLIDKD